MSSVLRPWVNELPLMQQSVLIAAVRGPDGIRKDHVAKLLLRWLRRCTLISAFDRQELLTPFDHGVRQGGSFTGASIPNPHYVNGHTDEALDQLVTFYLGAVDELPHHFQLHFMHACEILGYKYPIEYVLAYSGGMHVRTWWNNTYLRLVNDMHLQPESEETMDRRLGDNEGNWRRAEEVVAAGP